MLHQQMY